jgi:ABC-type Fe3+ transport system permease subunit
MKKMINSKSFALPVVLAVLVFAAAIYSGVTEYKASGSISMGSVALLFAAIAIGVLIQRLYEHDKELAELKKAVADKAAVGEDEEHNGENQ